MTSQMLYSCRLCVRLMQLTPSARRFLVLLPQCAGSRCPASSQSKPVAVSRRHLHTTLRAWHPDRAVCCKKPHLSSFLLSTKDSTSQHLNIFTSAVILSAKSSSVGDNGTNAKIAAAESGLSSDSSPPAAPTISAESLPPSSTPSPAPPVSKTVQDVQHITAVAAAAATKDPKDPVAKIIIKVQPTGKKKKTDFSQSYTANIFIPVVRAMNDYLLESSELDSLPKYTRRSPYPERDNITVYRIRDVEQKAIDKWGSLANVQLQKDFIKARESQDNAKLFLVKKARQEYRRQHGNVKDGEQPFIFSPTSGKSATNLFQHSSGRVVVYAIAVNAVNCCLKLVAWLYTGSHSMFSEFIHSLADTANQVILALGIHQSLKMPDTEHPYGWATFRNVSSLISGVGIFCVGAGLSYYHGIMGLISPQQVDSLSWALVVLGGSFISEGATLIVAINELRQASRAQNMSFLQYVLRGQDPSTNVVLLEDLGAVFGLGIAASCISLTHYTGSPLPDVIGSLLIGTLLASVATFIIYTNTMALVGKSIPPEKRSQLMQELESDRMIRTLHDVKATDVGGRFVRFKAEVDFDGREITRYYLEQQDVEKMMQEMQSVSTLEEVESFMLKHGENIVDTLGGEVDRIEKNLKAKHPEIRHCDLEQL